MISKQCGLDLDNVLAQTNISLFTELQNRGFLQGKNRYQCTDYRLEKSFPKDITYENVLDVFLSEAFWKSIPTYIPVVEGAQTLHENGVKVHIVTSRPPDHFTDNIERLTRDWLYEYNIPCYRLELVDAKYKADYCREHNLDFFVEDRLDTAVSISYTTTQSFLVAQPYNERGIECFPMVRRRTVGEYRDIYDIFYG